MQRDEKTAQATTGSNALVVRGYFDTLSTEVRNFWDSRYKSTPEELEAARKRQAEREENERLWRIANPEEAKRMDRDAAREAKRRARQDAKRKGTVRMRSPKYGSGTEQGYQAGERVQLRKEVEG
jgi:hypothetical protein